MARNDRAIVPHVQCRGSYPFPFERLRPAVQYLVSASFNSNHYHSKVHHIFIDLNKCFVLSKKKEIQFLRHEEHHPS